MAKLKTHKSSAKRFKVTKTGKLMFSASGWNHLKSKKDATTKYRKRNKRNLSKAAGRNVKRLITGIKNA